MSSVMRFDEWQDSDGNPVFNGAGGVSPGGLIAVKSAIRDIPFSQALNAGANVAVPDLSITHEVADPANRLIISAFFGAAASSSSRADVGLSVNDGTGFIAQPASPGSRSRVTAGGNISGADSVRNTTMPSVTFVHTPGAGSKTYSVHVVNMDSSGRTVHVSRSEFDNNELRATRAISSLVIQEVAV